MSDQPILNRQQLSQFLPTHEAIKAFEALFKYVAQTPPDLSNEILSLVAGLKTPSAALNNVSLRIEAIEQQQKKLNSSYSDILQRISNLEQLVSKKANNDDLIKRLQNLESIVGV